MANLELTEVRSELLFRLHAETVEGPKEMLTPESADLEMGEEVHLFALRPEVFAVEPVRIIRGETIFEGQTARMISEPINYGGTFFIGGDVYDLNDAGVDGLNVKATLDYFRERGYSKVIRTSARTWERFNEGDQVIERPQPRV